MPSSFGGFRPYLVAVSLLASGCNLLGSADEPGFDPYQRVGASAHDLLSGEPFKNLLIEVQSVEGYTPSSEALANLQGFLNDHLHKPGGIQLVFDKPLSPTGQTSFTASEVRDFERKHRQHFSQGEQFATYLLFLDSHSSDDTASYRTLGQSYWNSSIVLYEPSIQNLAIASGPGPQTFAAVESVVMLHEFGHLLGLVNSGTPLTTPHQDSAHGAHCNNPKCLMHYSVESGLLAQTLIGGELPALDEACKQDLKAYGGR